MFRRKIAIPFLTLILIIAAGVYYSRINYAVVVSLTFEGVSESDFNTIRFYGESPLNRGIYFQKTRNILNFSSLGNRAFIKDIYLDIPDSVRKKITRAELTLDDENFTFNDADFDKTFIRLSESDCTYALSDSFYKASLSDISKAFFTWQENVRKIILLVFWGVILVLFMVCLLFCKRLSKWRKWLGTLFIKMARILKNYFRKKLFFRICLIVTVFLVAVFSLVMHFGIYCNFSAYVFLLMLYGLWLLFTFGLQKFLSESRVSNIRLTFTSLFFMLIVVEFFLRFFDVNASYLERNTLCYERVFHKYKNSRYYIREPLMDVSYTTPEFKYYRKIYDNGFTQPMPLKEKKENEFRILAFGDSFTEGVGVPYDSSWVRLLNKKLAEDFPDKQIYIFNAGVVSSDPVFQYVLLTEKFNNYNFDMVIVASNESDLMDITLRGGFERFQDNGTVTYRDRPDWEWIYGLSYIFRLVIINGLEYNPILLKEEEFQKKRIDALYTIYEADKKFYNYTRENNQKLILLFHPSQSEVINPSYYLLAHVIRKLNAQYKDIHVLNLKSYFVNTLQMNLQNINDYYWKIDGHHNGKGYNAFAEGVRQYIKENKLIE